MASGSSSSMQNPFQGSSSRGGPPGSSMRGR
jgi:hypothetical protein